MDVSLECFKSHVSEPHFQFGLDDGDWGFAGEDEYGQWPVIFLWGRAVPKNGMPDKYFFKFDLNGYPAKAPTACPWDIDSMDVLPFDKWPKGSEFVSKVFNPGWKPKAFHALYAPCDRVAMEGHEQWAQAHKGLWWQPNFTIVKYLDFLLKLLTSKDYING